MEFRNLENCDFDTLFQGFERAFADYEVSFEKEEVRSMLKRRGYDPRLSFAIFDNGKIVAFTLNGIGMFKDLSTAYDTGTGTVKDYRGKGLAAEIFTRSIPFLKDSGVMQYLLEVLQNNHKAIAVYQKLGFEIVRELDCFRQTVSEVVFPPLSEESSFTILPVDIDTIASAHSFCDFTPSWQNSLDSIKRGESGLILLGAYADGEIAGYCVFDSTTGDLTQIAVKQECRRKGVGTLLLHEAINNLKTDFIKVLNVSSTNRSLPAFLASRNIRLASRQFEMLLQL